MHWLIFGFYADFSFTAVHNFTIVYLWLHSHSQPDTMNGAWYMPWRRLLLTLPPQQRTIPHGLTRHLANYPDPRTNSSHYTHLAPLTSRLAFYHCPSPDT